jgi:hypothetical protein
MVNPSTPLFCQRIDTTTSDAAAERCSMATLEELRGVVLIPTILLRLSYELPWPMPGALLRADQYADPNSYVGLGLVSGSG